MEKKYDKNVDVDNLIVEEILVLLQEKRTALRMVRIGIGAIIAQITILGFLIATSKYYEWMEVMHLWIPFVIAQPGRVGGCRLLYFWIAHLHTSSGSPDSEIQKKSWRNL